MTLLYLVAAWTAGIFFASGSHTSPGPWLGLATAAAGLAFTLRSNRAARLTLVCVTMFSLGATRFAWANRPLPENHVAHYAGSGYATLTGVIIRDTDVREHHTNLRIRAESLTQNRTTADVQGVILAQAPRYGTYRYGDRVHISGQILLPPEFDDFSYRDYLARQGIYAIVPDAAVTHLASGQGVPWLGLLYDLKERLLQIIERILPSPQAPLLAGILLGVENNISPAIRDAFNRTGTAHIIAISGANIIIVTRAIMGLLRPVVGVRRAGWLTMFGIAAYVLLVGADGAVVRAAIMGGLSILAWQLGRRTFGLTSLAFCIFVMSAWSPHFLWDIGFQLSVAATAGLVLLGDRITAGLDWLLRHVLAESSARQLTRWLAEPLTISLAAQIATTPLILVYFGRFSTVAVVANLLIVPIQPYIMTGGWLAVGVAALFPPAGELAGWLVWLPLTYTLELAQRLSALPWASQDLTLSPGYASAFYAALLAAAWIGLQHPDDRRALLHRVQQQATGAVLVGVAICLTVLVWIAAWQQPDGKLHVWFLDIGHGHAVLIQTPQGAHILVDGGPNPARLRAAVGDILPFWDRTIELLIVTHPKDSAIGALPDLLRHYQMAQVLTNGHPRDSASYRALQDALQSRHISVVSVTAGYRIETADGVSLEIVHPPTSPAPDAAPDDESLVIRLAYGQATFLLTSELSARAVQRLWQGGAYLGATVLELPDFGSVAANPPEFLKTVRPQIAVVGVEAGNRSQLPDPAVLDTVEALTGQPVYRTDTDGQIEMVTDGHRVTVFSQR